MMRRLLRSLTAISVVLLLVTPLTGCHSSRKAQKRTSNAVSATHKGSNHKVRDYSKEFVDPMGLALVEEARRWLGTPYAYGGHTTGGTDCSGMVMEVYGSVCGLKIPRTTKEQRAFCTEIARNRVHVGDLIFFTPGRKDNRISHVGIYIGKGEMIHASSSRGVMISNVDEGYWGERYHSIGRVPGSETAFEKTSAGKGRKGKGKARKNDAANDVPLAPPLAKPIESPHLEPSDTIDPLDLIIDQAVDSIFAMPDVFD